MKCSWEAVAHLSDMRDKIEGRKEVKNPDFTIAIMAKIGYTIQIAKIVTCFWQANIEQRSLLVWS